MTRLPAILFRLAVPLVLFFSPTSIHPQSTINSVPSTDVVSTKDVYLEFDFISNYSHHYNGGFQSYVPRAVVGLGKNVEAGANVVVTDGYGQDQPVEIQPNIKWRFFQNESRSFSASVGCIGYIPVNHRTNSDTFGMCYSVASQRLGGNYGPRFTGGGYALLDRRNGSGSKGGAIVGYEQPIAGRVNFVVDWFSGNNRFGYVTPGFSFATTSRSSLFTGYTIGNQGRRNHAFLTFYGIRL